MKKGFSLIGLIVVFLEATFVCWLMVHVYSYLISLISSADSLTILDFSRDLLCGVPMGGWNLSHAPFLFPDAVIASFVLIFGWSNNFSLFTIAVINYSLFIIVSYLILKAADNLNRVSLAGVGLMVTLSLLVITHVFPVPMRNIYWQIFASGTHFGSAFMVALILFSGKAFLKNSGMLCRVFFLFSFTVATVVSDTMAFFLLMLWILSELLSCVWKDPKVRMDMIVVSFSMMIGEGLNMMIPHQSLAKGFFSMHLFMRGFHAFMGWAARSSEGVAFIVLLVISSMVFPFLIQGRWPKFRKPMEGVFLGGDFVLPSLGIIVIFPMFFEDVGSLRYLVYPAYILILCGVLVYLRLMELIKNDRLRTVIPFVCIFLICVQGSFILKKISARSVDRIDAAKIYQCIKRASLEFPLDDGIASYWNARPLKFYSNFKYYLAQTTPWSPKDGYFYWGNNGYDFIYKNTATRLPRRYNYIIATNDEIKQGLWGDVIYKSKHQVSQEGYTLFYFDREDILWDFLLFRGPPLEMK